MEMTLYELRARTASPPSPAADPVAGPVAAPASAPASAGCILLVDDDPDFRGMVRIAFQRAGYDVREAENGHAALTILADHRVDLVVTDIIMPEADGYEVILGLKEHPSRPPLIAVTGGSLRLRMELPGMARLLGADAAFEKPLDLKELMAEAGRLIAARRADAAT
ncbi:two-component response regulator (plasmid) [Azospirillum sp. B510]|uniref:response regulator n=1 Tax=Azospirillum sp. (strain B510) TaxID=137722 RepID=UPI0001C4C612|nr:response regulator [Azospirillum sp. B510]BAI76006.1 two-component response regulator [Azospirillum sp. B510]